MASTISTSDSNRPPGQSASTWTKEQWCGVLLDQRYLVTEHLASGGMGSVYKAIQKPLERAVAVKLLLPGVAATQEGRERFFLEACLLSRLTHPNTVRVFDYGVHRDDAYYLVMEFLRGHTIDHEVRTHGTLNARRFLHITTQICGALIEAHEEGIVHRDIKPSNLFLTRFGTDDDIVKVIDFGLVKAAPSDKLATRRGITLGSPLCMAPEQIRDQAVDPRADIYALGIVMYIMLTGETPFGNRLTVGQLLRAHLNQTPRAWAAFAPHITVPDSIQKVVDRCLKKDPQDRFATTTHLMRALQECDVPAASSAPLASNQASSSVGTPVSEQTTLKPAPLPSGYEKTQAVVFGASSLENPRLATSTTEKDKSLVGVRMAGDPSRLHALQAADLDDYVAHMDLNCPFSFALNERLDRWKLVDKIDCVMVEHASHIINGELASDHEQALVKDILNVQGRAPDIEVVLPSRRYRSLLSHRLLWAVKMAEPSKLSAMRTELFRLLWQRDENIESLEVLQDALRAQDLSASLLDSCHEDQPGQLEEQRRWEEAGDDACIPAIEHRNISRRLIGLSSEAELAEFFLDERSRDISSMASFCQRKPTVLVLGLMRNLWPLLRTLREHCEVVLAPRADELQSLLMNGCSVDLLLVDWKTMPGNMLALLADSARTHCFPWVVATHEPSPDEEKQVLSAGAAEYLPIDGSSDLAMMRLNRILRDRVTVRRRAEESKTDRQTSIATRRHFTDRYEREWERAIRKESVISLIDVSVDDFKAFNDTHGYSKGDAFLSTVVASWSTLLASENQLLARMTAEKFLVMLPRVEKADAEAFGERMRHAALRSSTRQQDQAWILTLSVGVSSVIPRQGQSLYKLIDQAAKAREEARALGGNQMCVV